jgi:hypothetical protein
VRSSRGHAGGISGDGAIYGQTSPGGVLSPLMMVTLASLRTGRDRDEAIAEHNSLFSRATLGNRVA